MEDAVMLTRRLVQIDSSDPGAYEGEIGRFIFDWLKEQVPSSEVSINEVLEGRYNIRAILKGATAHPALVFICHMDTVVLGDGWKKSSPLSGEEHNGRIYGRGACDMKSGLAAAMCAFREIGKEVAEGKELSRDLILIGTVDEEDFMRGAESAIREKWVTSEDWILDTEPTNGLIRMAHKGRLWIELEMRGITAHASTPEAGADANAALAEVIHYIRQAVKALPVHEKLGKTTVTFGQMEGGYRPYVVPDFSQAWLDIRHTPLVTTDKMIELIDRAVKHGEQEILGVKGYMKITGDRPAIEEYPASLHLLALKEAVKKVTSSEAEVGIFTGYTDTAVIAGMLGNRHCLSYGPGELEMAHKPDEFVAVADIMRCYEVLKELAQSVL